MRGAALVQAGLLLALGCADGDALRRGLEGERPRRAPVAPDAAARDAAPRDGAPVDAAPPADAGVDAAVDPRCTPEICNDLDDDCDGSIDEGVADCCMPGTRRPCSADLGECTAGEQFCTIDLEWSACTGDLPTAEICEGARDEDCDGAVDEGLINACGGCGPAPAEICNARDDDCDGTVDEGLSNACGGCGPVPEEICNDQDDDCDGMVDEGLINACGGCGATPVETCNGADDDCDGETDEGVTNACGGCGAPMDEACNGADDDCDGRVDETACHAWVLEPGADTWSNPPGLNARDFVREGRVDAVFMTSQGGLRAWAFVRQDLYRYDLRTDRWRAAPEERFAPFRPDAATVTPVWWESREGLPVNTAALTVFNDDRYRVYRFNPGTAQAMFVGGDTLDDAWQGDRNAPEEFPLIASLIDLHDARDLWPGDVAETCGRGAPGPVQGVLNAEGLYTADAGTCFRFMDRSPVAEWAGFALDNAPPPHAITAWDVASLPDGTSVHLVFTGDGL